MGNDNKRNTFLSSADKFQVWESHDDKTVIVAMPAGGFIVDGTHLTIPQATGLRDWLSLRLEERKL